MEVCFPPEYTYRGHYVVIREVSEEIRYPDQQTWEPPLVSVAVYIDGRRLKIDHETYDLFLLMQQGRTEDGVKTYIDAYLAG